MNKVAAVACMMSLGIAGAAGWGIWELKRLEAKVASLEAPPESKPAPAAARPADDDPRGKLAVRIEALERRLDESDAGFAFNADLFAREAKAAEEEIGAQTLEIMAKLAELKANPPSELSDAILEERVRAGLLEKRKKDLKKLVKKEGQKNLKRAKDRLNLTEQQMEELKKFFEQIYDEWTDTLARIFSGEEIPQADIDAKVADTKARADVKMKEVMTPEQYDTWKKEIEPTFYRDPFQPQQGGGDPK